MKTREWRTFEKAFENVQFDFKRHAQNVESVFRENPSLSGDGHSAVHSTKMRMKDLGHLRKKIDRKHSEGVNITPDNLTKIITDLAGVRILLLFRSDFRLIDALIRQKVNAGEWALAEKGKALVWDPEDRTFFQDFDLQIEDRDTHYTSVHYLIKPRADQDTCCEVQVRTLFEEIWGEVDHRLNYPIPSEIVACREQLRVLSKIVGAGSRLLESLQRTITNK